MNAMKRFFGSGIALRPGDVPRYVEVPGSREENSNAIRKKERQHETS
jgi:hypothetical protein